MAKSKVHMPKELEKKCHVAIHTATVAATAAGAIPIPMADTIPITSAQIAMVIGLGKVFDVSLSDAVAKSILGCGLATRIGRTLFTNILKAIPIAGHIAGPIVAASTAALITETLGWLVADDLFRMSQGQKPENLDAVEELEKAFLHSKQSKYNVLK